MFWPPWVFWIRVPNVREVSMEGAVDGAVVLWVFWSPCLERTTEEESTKDVGDDRMLIRHCGALMLIEMLNCDPSTPEKLGLPLKCSNSTFPRSHSREYLEPELEGWRIDQETESLEGRQESKGERSVSMDGKYAFEGIGSRAGYGHDFALLGPLNSA
ncbi:hypothetical protein PM082_000079 [Marasmius tenuissimus]|nr:hypothetical protein PM082_000079 [Marasmius tenuissimus]